MTRDELLARFAPAFGGLILLLSALSVTIGGLETMLWFRARYFFGSDQSGRQYLRRDPSAGWTLRPGIHEDRSPWKVEFSTTTDGLRARLNPGARRRVLVIGDSFTEAVQVADDSSYAARLAAQRHDLEFVVMGVGGYGTLQELIQFERLVRTGRVDAVIWQVSNNDVINNDFELEQQSLWNNNATLRPYLEPGGRVVARDPSVTGRASRWLLWRAVAARLRLLRVTQLKQRSIEQDLDLHPAEFLRALGVTRSLFYRARLDLPGVPMIAFLADREFEGHVLDQAASQGFIVAPVRDTLDAHATRGQDIAATKLDAHWNALGHALASQVLLQTLDQVLPREGATAPAPATRDSTRH